MKKHFIYKLFTVLALSAVLIAACTKDQDEVKLDAKLSTSQYTELRSDSVNVTGFIVAAGEGFTERGVCFSTSPEPNVENNKEVYTGDTKTATFKVKIKVNRLTKYYVRAYAINATKGIMYGDEYSFTTPAALAKIANIIAPVLQSTTDKGITATTDVNITDDGGPDATANIIGRGVVFGPNPNPTLDSVKSKLASNKTITTTEGVGSGQFTSLASSLNGKTKYYYRAYATNGIGTTYSNELNFTTGVGYGTATTSAATKITKNTVTLNGVIKSNGGGTISEKGFVYSLTAIPTIANTKIAVSSNKDSISADITSLSLNTKYYVRTYVTNETGTNYGEEVTFTTLADITKFWIVGDATANGWNNNDNAPFIISTVSSAGAAEGYVYLTVGKFKLTTDHSWDNAHTFGDNGSGKLINPGSDIAVSTAGYYLVKANLSDMSYSLTMTTWGIIGDATAGGWGSQTNMNYDATKKIFYLGANLLEGKAFKFRGTSDWGVNYGSDAADGKLNPGGANIPVTATDDYAITLDLSNPNAYTYSANRWGLIGSATSGGWGSDLNMAWDATNNVFKVTTDLVAGAVKFRANDEWALALGGTADALSASGGDIAITVPGNYTITMDPWGLKATFTKN